jgi:outer membrane immunogenic protein
MKRILIVGAFALLAGGQALAAALPPPVAPPPRAPAVYVPTTVPYYNWGGIYLGINGGYGFSSSNNWTGAGAIGASTGNFSTSGALVGGTIGFNYQTGAFVFGVEGDGDWSGFQGSSAGGCGALGVAAGIPAAVTYKTSSTWLGTGRGRLGYAFDRILLYGTGGGAFGNVTASTPGSGFGNNSSTDFGWTAGVGIEGALTQNWTAKVEYLYVSLANGTCTTACGSPVNAPAVTLKENLIRGGINYKFSF